jgi:hypothetical protein
VVFELQVLLDVVPTDDWTAEKEEFHENFRNVWKVFGKLGECLSPRFLNQHQRRVDQDENVAGDVKSVPKVPGLQAASLCLVSLHIAPAVGIFNHIEQIRPTVPEESGDDESRDVVFQELLQVTATKREIREIQEGR